MDQMIQVRPDTERFVLGRARNLGEEQLADLESLGGGFRANDFEAVKHG
jgi:hypothetical protein